MGGLCTCEIQNPASIKYTHIQRKKRKQKLREENNILFELNVTHYKLIWILMSSACFISHTQNCQFQFRLGKNYGLTNKLMFQKT